MATLYYGTISSGTTSAYNSGNNIADYTIYGTATLNSASDTGSIISSGGVEFAGQAGVAIVSGSSFDDIVMSGGTLHAENYGWASGTILSGGTLDVDNGGSATAIEVSSGGSLLVYVNYNSGGIVTSTTVHSGGREILSSGTIGNNDIVESGGSGIIYGGATEIIASGSGAGMTASGGQITITSGGIATSETAASGGYILLNGGSALSAVILSGAKMDLGSNNSAASVASNTLVDGGTVYMYSNGSSVSGTIENGGTEWVGQGGGYPRSGYSLADTVSSGGSLIVENGGLALSTTISSGGSATVDNGAVISNATVSSAGLLTISTGYGSAGSAIATTVSSGGTEILANGGSGFNDQVLAGGSGFVQGGATELVSSGSGSNMTATGGNIIVSSGGYAYGETVSSGYIGIVGGSATSTTILSGNHMDLGYNNPAQTQGAGYAAYTQISGANEFIYRQGLDISATIFSGGSQTVGTANNSDSPQAVASGATISSGGTQIVQQAATAYNTTISSGGTQILQSSGAVGSATTILNGGVQTVSNGYAYNDVISSGGLSQIYSSGAIVSAFLHDRGSIDFEYLGGTVSSATVTSNGLLTAYSDNGSATTLQLAGTYPDGENTFLLNGDTVTLVCFLGGTMIRTPDGETAVEELSVGDLVLTHDPQTGTDIAQPLRWVGTQRSMPRPHLPDDEAGYPVRITKDALAPNVPHMDLLVTPEHCLFLEGGFIPARMLVNGRSIIYDRTPASYSVYHIETNTHSILWSNGARSESYLDTGNRRNFTPAGRITILHHAIRDWVIDAAAPLTTTRPQVEPIYQAIVARADTLGRAQYAPAPTIVQDHDLHLVGDRGHIIHPMRTTAGRILFRIPAGTASVHLASRASRPCDAIGPFVDDRRTLGVLIGDITFYDGTETRMLDAHLAPECPAGWAGQEASPCRWTQGFAMLPLGPRCPEAIGVLAIEVLAAGPFIADHHSTMTETVIGL